MRLLFRPASSETDRERRTLFPVVSEARASPGVPGREEEQDDGSCGM